MDRTLENDLKQSEEIKNFNKIVLSKPAIDDNYKQWLIDSIKPANDSKKAIVLSDFLKNHIRELKPEPLMMIVNSILYNTISNLVLLNCKTSIFDKFSYEELTCDICNNKWKEQIRKDLSYWLSIGK